MRWKRCYTSCFRNCASELGVLLLTGNTAGPHVGCDVVFMHTTEINGLRDWTLQLDLSSVSSSQWITTELWQQCRTPLCGKNAYIRLLYLVARLSHPRLFFMSSSLRFHSGTVLRHCSTRVVGNSGGKAKLPGGFLVINGRIATYS
jgi:hypothetical protein